MKMTIAALLLDAIFDDDSTNLVHCDTAGFILRKWTLSDGNGNLTEKTQIIWIEPVARVIPVPKFDTICDGDSISVVLTSPTSPTNEIRFDYTVDTPNGVSVVPNNEPNLPKGSILNNRIYNSTDTFKLVQFIITPHLWNATNNEVSCAGENDTAYIWVEPTAKVNATPSLDTICNGDTISVRLSSPTVPTHGLRFRYTTEVPEGVTVVPETDSGLDTTDVLTQYVY